MSIRTQDRNREKKIVCCEVQKSTLKVLGENFPQPGVRINVKGKQVG